MRRGPWNRGRGGREPCGQGLEEPYRQRVRWGRTCCVEEGTWGGSSWLAGDPEGERQEVRSVVLVGSQ